MRFAHFIKERRLQANFGLREFAKKVGISPTYQSRIESGHFPPPSEERIIKMAEILDGDLDFFLAMAGKVHSDTIDAVVDTMGLWSHFIRNNKEKFKKGTQILQNIDFRKLKNAAIEEVDGHFWLIIEHDEGKSEYFIGYKNNNK